MQICQNCSTITIETSPTRTAIKGTPLPWNSRYYEYKLITLNIKLGRSRKHWYAAPYPSSFHWYEGIKELPWELTPTAPKRTLLALIIGSVRTSQPTTSNLRKLLHTQCTAEPAACQWHKTAHSCSGVCYNSILFSKFPKKRKYL